jgi:hypothetical protein
MAVFRRIVYAVIQLCQQEVSAFVFEEKVSKWVKEHSCEK